MGAGFEAIQECREMMVQLLASENQMISQKDLLECHFTHKQSHINLPGT